MKKGKERIKKFFKLKTLLSVMILMMLFTLSSCTNSNNEFIEFTGKKIGYLENTGSDSLLTMKIKKVTPVLFTAKEEMTEALMKGEIDGEVVNELAAKFLMNMNDKLTYEPNYLFEFNYSFLLNKSNEKLNNELNEYLNIITNNNKLFMLFNTWTGDTGNIHDIDIPYNTSYLTIKVAVNADTKPLCYYDENGKLVGYEIAILSDFAKEYHYNLEFVNYEKEYILDAISEGCDIASGSAYKNEDITDTNITFSNPYFLNSLVILKVLKENDKEYAFYNSLNELRNSTVGMFKGYNSDSTIKNITGVNIKYYDDIDGLYNDLHDRIIDAIVIDDSVAYIKEYFDKDVKMLSQVLNYNEYGFIANKESEFSQKVLSDFNEYIKAIESTGEYQELTKRWITGNPVDEEIKYEELPCVNGTIRFATSTEIGKPFSYYKDDKLVGFEIEMLYNFCKKYGYAITIDDIGFSDLIQFINEDLYDFGGTALSILDDRKEFVDFTRPYYFCGTVVVVLKAH